MKKNEIRKHYFQDKYVIISPKRGKRPHRTKVAGDEEKAGKECFMCPKGKVKVIYDLPDLSGGWLVRVIKNIYPALSLDNKYAYGKQEIVIESPDHEKEIHELSIEHIRKILDVYSERYESLVRLEGIRYVIVFKNEGGKAGESINHAHSQIIALPMIPPLIREEILAIDDYQMEHKSCPHCDILKNEKKSPRVAWEDKHIFALCPYASEYPYGVWFIPKRHVSSLGDMTGDEKLSLAKAMKHIIGRVEDLGLNYNYFFHNSIDDCNHHMILEFAPRPNVWAGLELGTGIIINTIPPEDAAKFYRGESKGGVTGR
ncbi:DUF4931 domain-containing protein [candidate division WS5 bacterium]|uniref:DUF4931 domain-containing protein n=1 Tax=candidate division WS5 bacterium TaxID=2093353 RepID=A0A419DAW3_9BACT|nr:MAG: DUF4931 domain-containing protein [candidate division WS5 bacterium]